MNYEYISQSPREDDKYGVIFNYKCDKIIFVISAYKNEDGTIAIDSVKTLCEDNESVLSQLAVIAGQVLSQIEEDIQDKLDCKTEIDFDGDLMLDDYTVAGTYGKKYVEIEFSKDYSDGKVKNNGKLIELTEMNKKNVICKARKFAELAVYEQLVFDKGVQRIFCKNSDNSKNYRFLVFSEHFDEKTSLIETLLNTINEDALVSVDLCITIYYGRQNISGNIRAFILKDELKEAELQDLELMTSLFPTKVKVKID